MQIENVKISTLKPAEYNPREMTEKQAADLTESIKRFGLVDPLIVNRHPGRENVVIGGHQRLKIAQNLGFSEVPAVFLDLDAEKEKELNLRLNLNLGQWDWDALANFDRAFLHDIGFDSAELNIKFGFETKEDEPPKVEDGPAISKTGDLYVLGEHRLLCGDATSEGDYQKLMTGQIATMVFTDPPYNINYSGCGGQRRRNKIMNDKMEDSKFKDFLTAFLKQSIQVTRGGFYVRMASVQLHNLWDAFCKAGGHPQGFIFWIKNHFTLTRSDYQQQTEPIMFGLDEETARAAEAAGTEFDAMPIFYGWSEHHWWGGRKQGNAWIFDKPHVSKEHPTMKPVALCGRAISNSSKEGQIVLDPFGGSGSTLIAAEQLKRRCFMMELDPKYCDVIVKRWENFTGQKAVKI